MPNLHSSGPDTLAEMNAQHYDLLPACIVSSTWPTAPGSGLTIAAFATSGYVRKGTLLTYVDQPARAITLPSSAGTYYLALTTDTHSTVGSFTRVPGSHYAYLQSASAPTYPDGSTPIASAVVSGGNITTVDTTPALTPPLSRQTADAVAITDGRISLGGHAPTGVLDVQGSVQASDSANAYVCGRMWPVAPAGATGVFAHLVEATSGAGLAGATFYGYRVNNQPTMANVYPMYLDVASGTNRYNVYAVGTAPNYFAGNVGVGIAPTTDALSVAGNVVSTRVFVGESATTDRRLGLYYTRASEHGIVIRPSADTGNLAVLFMNAASTPVGSISTTATATSYSTSSDRRMKRNVTPLANALATLRQLRPVAYFWVVNDEYGEGFLADELQRHVPFAVTGQPDAVDANGQIVPQGVDFGKVVPMLTQAAKELLAQVEALTARVASLEEQLGL